MKLKLRRQGDVYIYELSGAIQTDGEKELIKKIEGRALLMRRDQNILAYGESSGHAHLVEDDDVALCNLRDDDTTNLIEMLGLDFVVQQANRVLENNPYQPPRLLVVETDEATLIHKNLKTGELTKEHDEIKMPRGTYFVVHQREYAEQGTRQVWD